MAFSFREYGTFSGPGAQYTFRQNDDFTNIFEDPTFNLDDVSMVLLSTPSDYVYLHLDGTSTANVTLERSTGPITQFFVDATLSFFNGSVTATQVTVATQVTASGITLTTRKPFDIPHPNKDGWRLRHVCLEGPESGVYYRGRLTNSNVIELPKYWKGLVDPESITVTLTQIGSSQDLIVDKIEWGSKVMIRSGTECNIDCYFLVHGERKDGEKLIVEYEGKSIEDYPGDNSIYSINK